jgi:transketolase
MVQELKNIAKKIRYELIKISHNSKSSHLGGALSCVDILVVAYWCSLNLNPKNPMLIDRDRFILSKGHAISALYATLAYKNFFPLNKLKTYNKFYSKLPEQPSPFCVPGVEWATGSLGHGLSVGLGMAIGSKIKKRNYNVIVVLSDGECQEGSVWEAAMYAPIKKLSNLMVIIDYNKWQATSRSNSTMKMQSLSKKWESFGWKTYEVNGNSIEELKSVMHFNQNNNNKPIAIIANTIKGKGVSFMEDDNNWHYRFPTKQEVENSKKELNII